MESPAYLTLGSTSGPMQWGLFVSMAVLFPNQEIRSERLRDLQKMCSHGELWAPSREGEQELNCAPSGSPPQPMQSHKH